MTVMEQAASFGSATLHEAAGRTGALPSDVRPVRPGMRVVGAALPVRCPAGDNLWLHRAVYEAKPGDVLVCAAGEATYGYWGEILAIAALERGIAGLVINGGVRDTDQLLSCGFPTFASAVAIRGTGKNPALDGAVGEPVQLGDVPVRRGDLIVGDADGVVVIGRDRVEQVLEQSRVRELKERQIIDRLRAGATTIELLDLPRAES